MQQTQKIVRATLTTAVIGAASLLFANVAHAAVDADAAKALAKQNNCFILKSKLKTNLEHTTYPVIKTKQQLLMETVGTKSPTSKLTCC